MVCILQVCLVLNSIPENRMEYGSVVYNDSFVSGLSVSIHTE